MKGGIAYNIHNFDASNPLLAQTLHAHGLPLDTPALMAESVSTPEQSLHRSTVGALAERLGSETGTAPALILYGPLAESDDD